MEDYVSLPAQRMAHLVHKYVHHCHMKEIEGEYNPECQPEHAPCFINLYTVLRISLSR